MAGRRESDGTGRRAKTVVHLVPAMEQGGVERVVCDLNRALVRAGWRSVVVSRGGRLVRQIVVDGGEHVALDLKSKNPLTYLSRAWKLRRVIQGIGGLGLEGRRDGSDGGGDSDARLVVCAHSRVPAWLCVGARKIDSWLQRLPWSSSASSVVKNSPFLTYAHGANTVSRYSAVMTRGDRVVVPSKFLKGFLIENYADADEGLPASKILNDRIRVIYPAVDLARFDPAKVEAATVAALRREWGVRDGEHVVMSIGRITALKGFDGVIRTFAANAAGRLVIVGGVEKGKESLLVSLRQLASDFGVADRVVFAGARDCIPECLAIADEVVSGNVTKPESFGLSVAEALAMNKKVRLLKKFGGAGEILEKVEKWKSGKVEKCEETREAIRAMCDLSVMAKKTIEVYDECLRG